MSRFAFRRQLLNYGLSTGPKSIKLALNGTVAQRLEQGT
jgi:hypothetical protein